jgi:hypothetical protein
MQANKALEVLKDDTSEEAILARAVALRSKGLILRDLYEDLPIAIAGHKEALVLLGPLSGERAQVEKVLNLAE